MTEEQKDAQVGIQVKHRDKIGQAPFVMCNDWVLWDKALSDQARVTYLALLRFARQDGNCFPGQARLAAGRGVETRALRNHLAELVHRGLITVTPRGNGRTNVYWIEPLQDVYGSEDNPWEPSLEAKQQCWSPVGSTPVAEPEENWADRQREAVSERLSTGAAVILAAGNKSRDRKAERLQEQERKRAQRVPNKKQQEKQQQTVKAGTKMKKLWKAVFSEVFPGRTSEWETKHTLAVQKMLDTYGVEVTKKALEAVCREWESRYQVLCKATGNPNVCILWGFRDTIFAEIETGRHLDPGRRQNRLRDDEYQEGTADNARGGQW